MLQRLYIKNYTLIKEANIPFYKGMSVITGETGAGKSILLGALKLVLGERADYSIFHKDSDKCIIEAEFQIHKDLEVFFIENDLDYESLTIIRREISPDGKSRAFLNDSPVRLQVLQELSSRLIDIHSQFDTAALFDEAYQFQFLDNYAGLKKERRSYSETYNSYKENQYKRKELEEKLSTNLQSQDYNDFLLNELNQYKLEDLDLEELENNLQEMENVQEVQENLSQFIHLAQEEQIGLEAQLQTMQSLLQKATDKSKNLEFLNERFESLRIEFQDVLGDIENYATQLEYQPERIEEYSQKVNFIHNLMRKHQVSSVEELIEIRNSLAQEQLDFSTIEDTLKELKTSIEFQQQELEKKAMQLSKARNSALPQLTQYVNTLLAQVGLEKAQFEISLQPTDTLNEYGKEKIQMLFSANKGMPLQPIQNGISGGERSRVMLVLKKVMAEHQNLATLILDEIDTGVSGKVASSVGKLMQQMADDMQLIVITHLAQIASKGTHHYKVFKKEIEGNTQTFIELLTPQQRIEEIAQLISGDKVTEASLSQAKELLNS